MSMIALVRSWLLGVTGVAILTALAEGLMPEGTVKRVGKLTGGLILLIVALTPVLSLDLEQLLQLEEWENSMEQSELQLEDQRKNQWEELIVEELEAYIVDKGGELGISCRAEVVCRSEGEVILPHAVSVTGQLTEEQKRAIKQLVTEDLGIPEEHISFTEEGAG